MGQEYQDLRTFDKDLFLETVFGKTETPTPSLEPQVEPQVEETPEEPQAPEEKVTEEKTQEPEIEIPEEKVEEVQEEKIEEPEIKEPQEIQSQSDDPFEGISDDDIKLFADLYDVPPPDTDQKAKEMASKIRKWISNGRPKPGDEAKESVDSHEDSEKPKKKRSLFW